MQAAMMTKDSVPPSEDQLLYLRLLHVKDMEGAEGAVMNAGAKFMATNRGDHVALSMPTPAV